MESVCNEIGMRRFLAGPRLLTEMALAAIVPVAPLLLFQHPPCGSGGGVPRAADRTVTGTAS
jgi:hypothetical protein